MRIGVLGAVEVLRGGEPVEVSGRKQRMLLAALALYGGRPVAVDTLVDLLWGDDAPDGAVPTLHVYLAGMRRILEPDRPARTPATVIVTVAPGYALRLADDAIDAARFGKAVDLAHRRLGAWSGASTALAAQPDLSVDELAEVIGRLDEALASWRGTPYIDLGDAPAAMAERTRLEGLRIVAIEARAVARLALGEHATLAAELEALTAEHPLRERLWILRVLALAGSGRQADALDALRQVRHILAEELGLDPGTALRELESAVLRQDPALIWQPRDAAGSTDSAPVAQPTTPAVTAAVAAAPERSSNIPFAISGFVGRAKILLAVQGLVERERLVTLTGAGGMGKTRLALEVARSRGDVDGPWLVELAGLAQPELVVATVAAALGVPGAATAEHLAAVLSTRDTLLILDNCEHLVDAVRDLSSVLLAHCGSLRILATSRESLGITGEVVFEVPPMSPDDDAVDLFLSRAATMTPQWTPSSAELEIVRGICAELDGIPLAIELAAAQCRVLSVGQIAGALDDRFGLTVVGGTDLPARHRGLAEAISWSYDLLDVDQRHLFGRLSVFAGGFDLDAATAVAGAGVSVTRMISPVSTLVRKSLLTVEPDSTPRRYRMLETLRRFASDTLPAQDSTVLQAGHRAWVIGWVEAAERRLHGPDAFATMARLTRDQAEIRAAISSALFDGDGEAAMRICGALYWFWYRKGHIAEGLGWLRAALELAPATDQQLRARAMSGVGALTYLSGDPVGALRAVEEAADAARVGGDLAAEAHAMLFQAHFTAFTGDLAEAIRRAEIGLELARQSQTRWMEAEGLMVQGMLRRLAGQTEPAGADLSAAAAIAEECGHHWAASSSTWAGMKIAMDQGDPQRALGMVGKMLGLLEAEDDVTSWLVLAHSTAAALAQAGRAETGAVLLGAVAFHGGRVGFLPELMDPIDGPREAKLVRDALASEELARHLAEGAKLTRLQVNKLISPSATAGTAVA